MSKIDKPIQNSVIVKLQVKAGEANPGPPVGPTLGQHGVNIMECCKAMNMHPITQKLEKGTKITACIFIDKKTKKFVVQNIKIVISDIILKEAGLSCGSKKPSLEIVGKLKMSQIKKIAEVKMQDLTAASLEAAMRTVTGSARSMGIEVIDG